MGWSVLSMIGAALGIAQAMDSSGAAEPVGEGIVAAGSGLGSIGVLAGVRVGATIAASFSFSTPIDYQTNLMVYGPGGYRFRDFTRVGVPLQLIQLLFSTGLILLIWPLIV